MANLVAMIRFLPLALLALLIGCQSSSPQRVDVCVYGGTASGVIASVTAKQQGKSVVLVEPGRHLGGMSSGGLGWTDFGNKAAIGGLSLDFYKRVGKVHGESEPAWRFEPSAAERVFSELVKKFDVPVIFEHRVTTVQKHAATITQVAFEHAPPQPNGAAAPTALKGSQPAVVEAKVYIDCTYEGDLMARAGVNYHVGRESVETYNEPHNGLREKTPKHQFLFPVDPYNKPGDPTSGLIPLVQPSPKEKPGDGDRRVQAYNFRLCLTKNKDNQIPIVAPPNYDPAKYELLARYVEASIKGGKGQKLGEFMHIQMVVPEKTDINNNGAVSTDHIAANWDYPEATYARRGEIWTDHLRYTQGLLYYLATSDRIPQHLRDEIAAWGLCRDEFKDTGGWPHQLYVREARRMIGQYVVTENDCNHIAPPVEDSIGLGAYNMDSHNCNRIVQDGVAKNEGDVQVAPAGPYRIPYRAITPKSRECDNLLVPVCLSSSHIAYGSIRMEPVFMVLGESAAVAACDAIDANTTVQNIDTWKLQQQLQKRGQVLAWVSSSGSGPAAKPHGQTPAASPSQTSRQPAKSGTPSPH